MSGSSGMGMLRWRALRAAMAAGCAATAVAAAGQCTNSSAYGTAAAPTTGTPLTISTCTYQTEYNTITGVAAGSSYTVSSSCGGFITVRHTAFNGPVAAIGMSPVTFTAPVGGTYYIHYNTNAACGTATTCCTTTITCTSCGSGTGCINTTAYGSAAAPTNSTPFTISTCTYQSEYNTITGVVAGQSYTVSSSCGGWITVRLSTYNGPLVAQGPSPLTFNATVSGTYYIHYNTNASCGTASICCTTTITGITCTSGPPAGACTAVNIPSLPVSAQPVACHASNLITALNVTSFCGSASTNYLGGYEALYTVTPTTTGNYIINYNGQAWSSIWVFSGACPAAGGLCQGSTSSSSSSQSLTVTMNAGTTYWILFDTWPTPQSPCPGTFSISASTVPPPVVASDCSQAVPVCTNINFQIDPNGYGSVHEIPALGSLGNPDFLLGDSIYSPWGSDNYGCLRAGELNSTWMVVNVLTGGSLEFVFGGLGTQAGFYDWIMYPYGPNTCSQVAANLVAPVRCNWNGVAYGGTGLASTVPPGGDASNFEPPLIVGGNTQWLICFSNWSSVTTTVPLQFGGTAVVSCSFLPMELVSFEAVASERRVELEWVTARESGSSRFVVERSRDAETWADLLVVPAAIESDQPRLYKAVDEAPLRGFAYYRLRMLGLDGDYILSDVRQVSMNGPHAVVPNPAKGSFTVHGLPAGASIQLLDALGREVRIGQMAGSVEGSMLIDPLPALAGVYSLRVSAGGATTTTRVLIER
ncbi:MAG: T9SS type A sorting domain-containing protein [Flavobacteriales bacterium]